MDSADDERASSLGGGVLLTIHRLSQGGADRVAMVLANGFAAAGIPTTVAVLRSGGEGEPALLDMLDSGVNVVTAGRPMGSRHLELVRGFSFINHQIEGLRPAVVMASSSNMGLVTGLSARLRRGRRPRYVMKLTNPVIRPRDRGPIKQFYRHRLYQSIFGNFDRVLILTDAERAALTNMFPRHGDRFATVANPYVTPAMLADCARIDNGSSPVILTLARMMPQKRLDRLLHAFAGVTNKQSRLVIVGDGPERPVLERLARSLGIAERVAMPGFVADVVPWLRRADLFVLSSDYEGLPAAVLEALAANIPVVTTDCFPGARALLAGADHCAAVARDDAAAFARAIDASLADRERLTSLRDIARPYEIDRAIAAHVASLRSLF